MNSHGSDSESTLGVSEKKLWARNKSTDYVMNPDHETFDSKEEKKKQKHCVHYYLIKLQWTWAGYETSSVRATQANVTISLNICLFLTLQSEERSSKLILFHLLHLLSTGGARTNNNNNNESSL